MREKELSSGDVRTLLYISTGRPRWLHWKEKALQVTKDILQPFCLENPLSCAPEE